MLKLWSGSTVARQPGDGCAAELCVNALYTSATAASARPGPARPGPRPDPRSGQEQDAAGASWEKIDCRLMQLHFGNEYAKTAAGWEA